MIQNIAIIGAGISGLSAARNLVEGNNIILFDKSRGVGGRMSTRYSEAYEFDHGAQYFTAKDKRFKALLSSKISEDVIKPWESRAFYKKDNKLTPDTGEFRYVSQPRMNSFAKKLSKDLNIRLNSKVSSIYRDLKKWVVETSDGKAYKNFDIVILALPNQQALSLMPPETSYFDEVQKTQMDPCFALMVGFKKKYDFGWDSLRLNNNINSWLAVNSSKPGRSDDLTTLVIHSEVEWSKKNKSSDKSWIQNQMASAASKTCGIDISRAHYKVIHRWMFASVSKSSSKGCFYDHSLNIATCGDWCNGGRVEGAYISGLMAANIIKEKF